MERILYDHLKRVDGVWDNAFQKIFIIHAGMRVLNHCASSGIHHSTYEKTAVWKKMLFSEKMVLNMLAKCYKESMFALADKYHISPHNVLTSSMTFIKKSVLSYVVDLVFLCTPHILVWCSFMGFCTCGFEHNKSMIIMTCCQLACLSLCPFVRPSVTSRYCTKMANV